MTSELLVKKGPLLVEGLDGLWHADVALEHASAEGLEDGEPCVPSGSAAAREGRRAEVMLEGKPFSIMAVTVRGGKITEIDVLRDPERLSQLDLTALDA